MDTDKIEKTLDLVVFEVLGLGRKFDQLNEQLFGRDGRFAQIDGCFAQIDGRFVQIDVRFEKIDRRFEQIDSRMEAMEERLEAKIRGNGVLLEHLEHKVDLITEILQSGIDSVRTKVDDHEERITKLEIYRP